MKRRPPSPLLWIFFALAFGISLSSIIKIPISYSVVTFAVFATASGVIAILTGKDRLSAILLIFALIAFGALRHSLFVQSRPNDISRLVGRDIRLLGRVGEDIQLDGDRQRFDFTADSVFIDNEVFPAVGVTRVYLYRAQPVSFGDILTLYCQLEAPKKATNPHGFDFRKSLALKGINTIAFVRGDENVEFVGRSKGGLYSRAARGIRGHIEQTIALIPPSDEIALLSGLLLGRGSELPERVRKAFEDSGTVHILAVSGLHVGIIAGILLLVFGIVPKFPKPLVAIICILGLTLYSGVVGGRPSVLRATLMFSIVLFAMVLMHPPNLLNSIGAAGATLLIHRPFSLFDIGFQLSFSATLGIAYLLPYFEEWLPPKRSLPGFLRKFVLVALAVSLAANIATAPLIAQHFHRLQIISPLANIFVVPLVGIAIGYGILASLLSIFWQSGAIWVLYFNRLVLWLILNSASLFASARFAYIGFPNPNPVVVGLYYCFVIILPPVLTKKLKGAKSLAIYLAVIVCSIIALFKVSSPRQEGELRVTFFDVGQGDCALIEFADGRKAIIDGGPPNNAAFSVLPYLEAKNISKIDLAILSHPDADHLGGLYELSEKITFGAVAVSHLQETNELYSRFIKRLDSLDIQISILDAGDTFAGFPELIALWPDSTAVSSAGSLLVDVNEASLVVLLGYSEFELLFCGDIGHSTELSLLLLSQEVDILKVPHHGSRMSCSDGLIESTTPLVSIISVGARNRFGHPSTQVTSRLNQSGSKILRTDLSGAVTIEVIRDSILIRTISGETLRFSDNDQPSK